jgi:glycosyltransferase involved in cell wall biosynthesis
VRVVLVNTRHFPGGGDSTYTLNLAELLRAYGHEVAFFAMQDQRNLPDPNADLFVSAIDFAALHRARSLASAGQVIRRSIYSTEAREKFTSLLDRVRPDVVHIQSLHGHITPSIVPVARRRGIRVVWTLHDYKLVCPNTHLLIDSTQRICEACAKSTFYHAALRRCKKGSFSASVVATAEAYVHRWLRVQRHVDHFIAPSVFLRRKVMEMGGLGGDRISHVPYFLPDGAYRPSFGAGDYVLFFGRITPIKGVRTLLAAMREIPSAHLKLAGRVDESLRDWLDRERPPNVEWVGSKFGDELSALIAGARAVVVPSVWYENQPFSALESFAARRPVIASDLGGMAELVLHRERGLLVPPGDVQALAEAIRTVLAEPEAASRWGEQAFRYARHEHAAEKHYKQLLGIYGQNAG